MTRAARYAMAGASVGVIVPVVLAGPAATFWLIVAIILGTAVTVGVRDWSDRRIEKALESAETWDDTGYLADCPRDGELTRTDEAELFRMFRSAP